MPLLELHDPDEHARPEAEPEDEEASFGRRVLRWFRGYLARTARIIGVILVFAVVLFIVFGPRVRAQLDHTFLGMGEDLLHQPRDDDASGTRTLQLNGQAFDITTGTSTEPLGAVLDRFEMRCQQNDGLREEDVAEFLAKQEEQLGIDLEGVEPTIRDETERSGYVACVDVGTEDLDPSSWRDRLEAFSRALDVDKLGTFRYVYAERGDSSTFYVAIESKGRFEIFELFPERGDAPGADPEGVPRPGGARRILHAFEEGQPYGMTVYEVPGGDPDALEAHYREVMPERGWRLLEPEGDAARLLRRPVRRALVFERPSDEEGAPVGETVWLFFREQSGAEESAIATVLEAR